MNGITIYTFIIQRAHIAIGCLLAVPGAVDVGFDWPAISRTGRSDSMSRPYSLRRDDSALDEK